MKIRTAKQALDQTLKLWLWIQKQKQEQGEAGIHIKSRWPGWRKLPPSLLGCPLCIYAEGRGDKVGYGHSCRHCPCVVMGHCMNSTSPYSTWATRGGVGDNVDMVISAILGVQAEWERKYCHERS